MLDSVITVFVVQLFVQDLLRKGLWELKPLDQNIRNVKALLMCDN